MIEYLVGMFISLVVAVVAIGVAWYIEPSGRSNDSTFYFLMKRGEVRVPPPFSFRPLMPLLCGRDTQKWQITQIAAVILTGPIFYSYLYLSGFSSAESITGVLLWSSLYGMVGEGVVHIGIVDGVAMVLSLCSALLFTSNHYLSAMVVAALAILTKETSAIFISLFTLSPLPLLLIPISYILGHRVFGRKPTANEMYLVSPFKRVLERRRYTVMPNWRHLVAPWGIILPLAFISPSWLLITALVIAYAQLLVTTDYSRLYMWAFPIVIAHSLCGLREVPVWIVPFLLLIHLFHQYTGREGRV